MYDRASDGTIFSMLLDEKKLTIKDVALLTNIPVQTLYSLKKRKNNLTRPEITKKISSALGVPNNIWKISEEELTLRKVFGEKLIPTEDAELDSDLIETFIEKNNMSLENIKYALDAIGYDDEYSIKDIESILKKERTISKQLKDDIEFIVVCGKKLVSREELKMLRKIRKLSKDMRKEFYNMLDLFCDANSYRTEVTGQAQKFL